MAPEPITTLSDVSSDQGILFGLSDSVTEITLIGGTVEDIQEAVRFVWNLRGEAGYSDIKLKIVSPKNVLRDAVDDFVIGAHLAQLVADGDATLSVSEDTHYRVVVGDQTAYTVIDGLEQGVVLSTGDGDGVGSLQAKYDTLIEESDDFTLRVPPISKIRTEVREEFNDEVVKAFDSMFNELSEIDTELENAELFLLLAAHENLLLYDISKFGENVGVASKATFSRKKSNLEELGVIETEKVPIDIGRPRLRLGLTEAVEEQVEVVTDTLHSPQLLK